MPTFQPQRLSGLVVIPTVDDLGGTWRVSVGIDVGASRVGPGTAPPQTIAREDLIVELRNPTDGALEAIASPDPGPLPIRALRIVQARGDFTFAQGVSPATEVVVTVRGDRKTFPMSPTFAPTGCIGDEPKEGGPFGSRRVPPVSWPRRLLWPFRPLPHCCVERFDGPLGVDTDPAAKSEYFEVAASFEELRRSCHCACCEYRQFVRGTFTDANGQPVRFDMPSGALDASRYCEDGGIWEFAPTTDGYYGHRDTSSPGDEYAAKGCSYHANERVACPPTDSAQLQFVGALVDTCRRRVVAVRKWSVNL